MKALVLIDLDNVLHDRPAGNELADFLRDAIQRLERVGTGAQITSCAVCFGLNTDTAITRRLTFANVRAAGETIGRCVTQGPVRVEVGLVPVMPQAADVLLARMAREAPCEEAAGSYERAVVLSGDKGLIDSLSGELYGRSSWIVERDWLGASWRMPEGGKSVVRKPPTGASVPAGGTAPQVTSFYTMNIDSGGLASWAGQRLLDVGSSCDLRELALQVDTNPWLLSQVGATTKTVRGIERLASMPSSAALTIGRVADKDVIEVRGTGPCPAEVSGASAASVGIGAVRFPSAAATVASRIPASALATSAGPFRVDAGVLNISAALDKLSKEVCLGDHVARISLSRRAPRLVAKIVHASNEQPRMWWLGKATRTSSEHSVDGGYELLPRDVLVCAAQMKSEAWMATRLSLRSPLHQGIEVQVEHSIAAGTIGTAVHPTLRTPIALFSPRRGLSAQARVIVDPIHTVPRRGSLAAYPLDLWSLPLSLPR